MAGLDYSKWDHIEISDDEDDTHPNIDTPSLFRWRHQARLERETAWNKEKAEFENDLKSHRKCLMKAQLDYDTALKSNDSNIKELEDILEKLKNEDLKWDDRQKEMQKKERLKPWNVDTICKEGKSKTLINPKALNKEKPTEATEKEVIDRLTDFVDKHKKTIKQFGLFQKPTDSEQFLIDHPYLVCDETANQLVLWCIELAMEEKFDLMNHVSHQCIIMQFMLELAKSVECDPRQCIRPFFHKFINPEPAYRKAFEEELSAFRERIRERGRLRLQDAMEKLEEEERQKRLGPGGLDPTEVFETLPEALQECFEKRDVDLLKRTLAAMEPEEASQLMKRCIDSGLWVEDASQLENREDELASEAPAEKATGETETQH